MGTMKQQSLVNTTSSEAIFEGPKSPAQSQRKFPAITDAVNYARALRAIGDALESLHVEAFDLESNGNGCLVRGEKKSHLVKKPAGKNTLKSGFRAAWQRLQGQSPVQPTPEGFELHYSRQDLERLDKEGQTRRSRAQGMADTSRLSQVLRLVGAYLDLKGARLLGLSMREQQITLRYETALGVNRVEQHRIASLYDFSVNMYLHRADRKS